MPAVKRLLRLTIIAVSVALVSMGCGSDGDSTADIPLNSPEESEAVEHSCEADKSVTIHTGVIQKSSNNIAELNERVE